MNIYENVEKYLILANALDPQDERVLIAIGFEMLRQEKIDEAIEFFERALDLNPFYEDIRLLLELIK